MINQQLYLVVRKICDEIIMGFEAEGINLNSDAFLSEFSYSFVSYDQSDRQRRVVDAALVPEHKEEATRGIDAAYSNSAGGTLESYISDAVDDFLNYVIPRVAGLPDREAVFDQLYAQFDQSLYGKECVVTIFAVLQNVWDNGGRVVLPPGYWLRYYSKVHGGQTPNRWTRDRSVPYSEISQSARRIGLGRSIKDESAYFVFSYSTTLPKDQNLMHAAYVLRDEMVRNFIFSVRLLNSSAAFSDYRGFRLLGHLAVHRLNLMNFPEDAMEKGASRELHEHDGHRLRRMLPKLASETFSSTAIINTKIEDALRRKRQGMERDRDLALRVAIDQLLDYFQILEAIVPAMGSEFIALYAAVLLRAMNKNEDAFGAFEFLKRVHKVRNDVMHGRMDEVINSTKTNKFTVDDLARFRHIIHDLAGAYVMNGPLRDIATKLALGQPVQLISLYPSSVEEMNAMRRPQAHPATW